MHEERIRSIETKLQCYAKNEGSEERERQSKEKEMHEDKMSKIEKALKEKTDQLIQHSNSKKQGMPAKLKVTAQEGIEITGSISGFKGNSLYLH